VFWGWIGYCEIGRQKIRPLSDTVLPVRPPGEPMQTEFMMANDLRLSGRRRSPRATAFETKHELAHLNSTNKDIRHDFHHAVPLVR
jgi:hypothetical protein